MLKDGDIQSGPSGETISSADSGKEDWQSESIPTRFKEFRLACCSLKGDLDVSGI